MTRSKIQKLTTMGILIAISIILIMLLRIPYPVAPFLVYEPGDVPILIGGFIYGPLAGIILTIVSAIAQSLTVGKDGLIGCIMHIFATSALVGISAVIYSKKKTLKRAIIGLLCGSLAMAAVMIPLNLILDPLFYGIPVDEVMKLIIPALLPFNLLKAGINSIITLLIYKSVGKLLKHIARK